MRDKKIVFHCCTVYQLIVAIQVTEGFKDEIENLSR